MKRTKTLSSLLLALALCLSLSLPALAAGKKYDTYTLNYTESHYDPYGTLTSQAERSIKFEAARVEKQTLCFDVGGPWVEDCLVVLVKPGSRVSSASASGSYWVRTIDDLDFMRKNNPQLAYGSYDLPVKSSRLLDPMTPLGGMYTVQPGSQCVFPAEPTAVETVLSGASVTRLGQQEGLSCVVAVDDAKAPTPQKLPGAKPEAALPASGFADVKASAYYAQPVAWAVEKGITTGVTPTTFAPDQTCTQAQIITFLWRAQGSPMVNTIVPIPGVTMDQYFYNACAWAYANEIIDARFVPQDPCTRGTAVIYLYRNAHRPNVILNLKFTDITGVEADAVQWATDNGVTQGVTATTFAPDNLCTRGQIVTFLWRALAK